MNTCLGRYTFKVTRLPEAGNLKPSYINKSVHKDIPLMEYYHVDLSVSRTISNKSVGMTQQLIEDWCQIHCNGCFKIWFLDHEVQQRQDYRGIIEMTYYYVLQFTNKNDLLKFKLSW